MIDEKILIWLFRILKNKIIDFQRAKYSRRELASKYFKSHVEKKGFNNLVGMGSRVVPEFLKMITPQDKEILLVSYHYYNEAAGECEIPDKIRDDLCGRVGISVGNLRVRRSRLVARLISLAMSKQNPLTPTTL